MNKVGEIIKYDEITKNKISFDPNEVLKILRSNFSIFYSWGSTNFVVDNTKNTKMLRFKVNGMKHKGFVYIFLNGADLFDVYFTDKKDVITKIVSDLYFDQLVEVIDEYVKKQSYYRF